MITFCCNALLCANDLNIINLINHFIFSTMVEVIKALVHTFLNNLPMKPVNHQRVWYSVGVQIPLHQESEFLQFLKAKLTI